MSSHDPIADMLTIIRNAQSVKKEQVILSSSNIKEKIAKVLKEEGYINDFEVISDTKPVLKLHLKYHLGRPVIQKITRASKVSLRIYRGYREVPKVLGGWGIAILTTNKGVITDKVARQLKVGGEVLCYVS